MHKNKFLLIIFTITIGVFVLNYQSKAKVSHDESFEVLRQKILDKRIKHGKNYSFDGDYKEKLLTEPVMSCLGSREPFKKGSFVDKMLNDRMFFNTGIRMISKYINDENNPKEKRQYLFNYLLRYMYERRDCGERRIFPSFMLSCFNGEKYFNDESRKIIKKFLLVKNYDSRRGKDLFLIDLAGLYNDPQIQKYLREQAAKSTAKNFLRVPGCALLVLGRHGDKEAIEKIIKITSELVHKKKQFMAPRRLVYATQPEIVEFLRGFLKSKKYKQLGNTMPSFASVSHAAAQALSNMIIDYPKVNYWEYSDEKKKECIEWFDKHKKYKFNKKLNFDLFFY